MKENRLQDIPQFRTLEQNLELRVALQQVDRLTAENVSLKSQLNELKENILFYNIIQEELMETPEDLQKRIDKCHAEAASLRSEISTYKDKGNA